MAVWQNIKRILTKPHRTRMLVFAVIVVLIGGVYLRFAFLRYESAAKQEAIVLAQSLEALIHPEHIAQLTGTEEDLVSPDYIMTKTSLIRLVETTNDIRFAYFQGVKDGSIVFLVDSEPPGSPGYSPPGDMYLEAADVYYEPFARGETVITRPATDRWGTWVSVLVPVVDAVTGETIAVFGIDYVASAWYGDIYKEMIPDVLILACVFLLLLALFATWTQHTTLKKLSKRLAFDEALFRNVFDNAPIGVAIVNDKHFMFQTEFGRLGVNPMFEQILGRNSRELEGLAWTDITHPDDLQEDLAQFARFKAGEIDGYIMEKRFVKPDGSFVWTRMTVSPFPGDYGETTLHLCLLEDISVRKETEDSLRESERSKSVLLSHLPGMAYRCDFDRDWTMRYVSEGCYELTGYRPESLIDNRKLSYNSLTAPEFREVVWEDQHRNLENRQNYNLEYQIVTADGSRKWVMEKGRGIYDEQGVAVALEGIILDISKRKSYEIKLKYDSDHDRWTGLFNRSELENLLKRDAQAKGIEKRALISINLTDIQSLTTTYGFHYTSDLIKKTADALVHHCSDSHQLFNTYENRFVFYIKGYSGKNELLAFYDTIVATLDALLASERISIGIGILKIDEKGDKNIDQLLKNLLIASERAIAQTDAGFGLCFYDEEMKAAIEREQDIKQALEKIINGGEDDSFYLNYQPVLDLKTDKICGFEALARLKIERHGRIPPLEFIPIAEKTKQIVPLGKIIFRNTLRFIKRLEDMGFDDINVSVNISVIQLLHKTFVEDVSAMIKDAGVNARSVALEITESVFSENTEEINLILQALKDIGLTIAIDDFGTGYSSLSREWELHVDCLKIDKFFVDKLMELPPEKVITGDIISLAHKLGHCVVAEGVEFEEQLVYLKQHGCDKIQGYLISKPLNEEDAVNLTAVSGSPKRY